MINAFHINWTAPFKAINSNLEYFIDEFEIITSIFSALEWRRHNGTIKLYTDDLGAAYYDKLDLVEIWDEVNVDVLSTQNYNINSDIFWAAGKLICLKEEKLSSVMLDTDLIVFGNIQKYIRGKQLVVYHREPISMKCYYSKDKLSIPPGYEFNPDWNWNVNACNTAMLYINSQKLKDQYIDESLRFMENNHHKLDNRSIQMVFAEQRILAMLADEINIPIYTFLIHPYSKIDNIFFHTWDKKRTILKKSGCREKFCIKWLQRLLDTHPDIKCKIMKIECLEKFLSEISFK